VLQGEREMASDNRTLGRFDLSDIPSAPRGVPQIEVSFDIDANGIVHVSAKDLGTGKEQKIRIESSSGLDEAEINRMVKDAASHADEDKKRKQEIETRNTADSLLYQTEKTLREHGDKVGADDKAAIEAALGELRTALAGTDSAAIEAASQKVSAASHKLAEAMYAQAAPGGGATAGDAGADAQSHSESHGSGGGADDAMDADFEVVDDKKD